MSRYRRANAAGDATRSRILDAAWDLTVGRGLDVSMADIAAAAEVTRQTVYFHFASRAGLLVAMTRHRDHRERIGERLQAALDAPSAPEALVRTVRAWLTYLPGILPAARALQNAADNDHDAASAWWDRMDAIRLSFRSVIERLHREQLLDGAWTVDQATDLMWSMLHPRSWDDLVGHRRWKPATFVSRHIEALQRILLSR